MGKEAKIGLAVILVLLLVFGGVLYYRMTKAPAGPNSADPKVADGKPASPDASKPGGLTPPGNSPTIVAAKSDVDKLPKGPKVGDLDDWKVAGDKHDASKSPKKPGKNDSSPPSFMPKPTAGRAEPPALTGLATPPAPGGGADAPRYPNLGQSPIAENASNAPQPPIQAPPAGPFTSRILTDAVKNTEPATPSDPFAHQGQPNPIRDQDGAPPAADGRYAYGDGQSRYPSGGSGQYRTPEYNNASHHTYRTPSDRYSTPGRPYGGGHDSGSLSHSIDVGQQQVADDGSYVVQPSDSYWTISENVYGSGAYFRALAEHNRKRSPDADQLRPGEKIKVPPVAELEKNYRDLCPKPEHRAIAQQRSSMVSPVSHLSNGRVYVVQEGDTLFDIAKYELGKAGRWAEIFQLNRNALGDQYDYLTPGMELVLPADEPVQRPSETLTQRPGSLLR